MARFVLIRILKILTEANNVSSLYPGRYYCTNLGFLSLCSKVFRCCHLRSFKIPTGLDTAQLICGGCRTLLMYSCGATSVRCSCCHTVNLAPGFFLYVRSKVLLSSRSPDEVLCHAWALFFGWLGNVRAPIPVHIPYGIVTSASMPSTSAAMPRSQMRTVVVENPMSVDESGKLVSNVVVGVTTDKKVML
ncbi:hypothetical protein RJ639_029868 [Escallonia herrerae]|uniref:Zinc finger LSD1-type domain-containing protein n=1 Tax=Escallonia herrerae TaxID=1293975 RepID=A0AA89BDU1_9ASTE|nr:hypothetical protein RJ639_029868 [Escallonia herrerae]